MELIIKFKTCVTFIVIVFASMLSVEDSAIGASLQWSVADSGTYQAGNLGDPINDTTLKQVKVSEGIVMTSAGYLVFDFTQLTDLILQASLELELTSIGSQLDGIMNLNIYDVSTSIANLTMAHQGVFEESGPSSSEIMDDLRGGVLYGTGQIFSSNQGSRISIQFTQSGINAINLAAGNSFAVGLSLDPATIPGFYGMIISGVDAQPGDNGLTLATVPEPSTFSMFIIGLGILLVFVWRCPSRKNLKA